LPLRGVGCVPDSANGQRLLFDSMTNSNGLKAADQILLAEHFSIFVQSHSENSSHFGLYPDLMSDGLNPTRQNRVGIVIF
jgi:hypothetical protein